MNNTEELKGKLENSLDNFLITYSTIELSELLIKHIDENTINKIIKEL